MATQAQIDANRANAQKSTGPKTSEGRAAVRQNALKHGLTSMSPVAPGEDPEEFLLFLANWTQAYRPIGPAEEEVLRTAVVASWRLRRIPAIEAGYYEMEQGEIGQASDQAPSPAARLAFAHYHCARQLEALSCQESRLQRTFDRSIRELERLQALPSRGLKSALENQNQSSPQPEDAAPPEAAAPQSGTAGLENQTQSSHTAAAHNGVLENQSQFACQPDPTCGESALKNQTQFPMEPAEIAVLKEMGDSLRVSSLNPE